MPRAGNGRFTGPALMNHESRVTVPEVQGHSSGSPGSQFRKSRVMVPEVQGHGSGSPGSCFRKSRVMLPEVQGHGSRSPGSWFRKSRIMSRIIVSPLCELRNVSRGLRSGGGVTRLGSLDPRHSTPCAPILPWSGQASEGLKKTV